MRVVRSPVAHGIIRAIDASAALRLPGVHAVWTFADVAHIPPIGFRLTGLTALEPYRQYALAQDTRALCRRAGGGSVRRAIRTSPKTPPTWSRSTSRRCPSSSMPPPRPARSTTERNTEAFDHREEVRRRRRSLPRRASNRRARSFDRAAQRRAAGNTRGHRALRRTMACWKCTAPPRCRTGTETGSR